MQQQASGASSELQAALVASREALFRSLVGVSEEQFKRRPAAQPDEPAWCIAEVLAHLLASEQRMADRLQLALDADPTPAQPWEHAERQAVARTGRLSPVPQLIHGLLASRRRIELLLEQATREGKLGYALQHSTLGAISFEFVVREQVIAHEREHLQQVLALRQEVGAPPVTEPPNGPAAQ